MKLTTVLLIVMWPITVFMVLLTITTVIAHLRYISNSRLIEMNKLRRALGKGYMYYPWKSRTLYSMVCIIVLCYLHGWLILA